MYQVFDIMTHSTGPLTGDPAEQIRSALLSQPLVDSDIHVWRAALAASPEELAYFQTLLSPDEKSRAVRFYFDRDRNRYIAGRGMLRILLGHYAGVDARDVPITYGPQAKPLLEQTVDRKRLEFNLSNTEDWAVIAFCWNNPVGVDIERVRPFPEADAFAQRFYSSSETALLNSSLGDAKWDVFFKFWTCKEAFLKAKGSGLTFPLNQVEISLSEPDVQITSINGDPRAAAHWRLKMFNPIAGYQAAIAVEEKQARIILQN